MKKIFFALAAFAAMAVVSCVKDERDPQSLVPAPDPVYDYSGLVLNELSGAGEDNEKFWELYNGGTSEVGLKGVYINKDEELAWTGVKGQTIKPGEVFAIIGAKGTTESGFSSGFSAKKNVIVELFAPDGTRLDVFQRGEKGNEWGGQTLEDLGKLQIGPSSWSRIPNGSGKFMITPNKTPGAANNDTDAVEDATLVGNKAVEAPAEPPTPAKTLVLNELNGNAKYIELYNNTNAAINLKDYKLYKDDEFDSPIWIGQDGMSIAANGYLTLDGVKGSTDYTSNFGSGLSADKSVAIELRDPQENTVDRFTRGSLTEEYPNWGDMDPLAKNGEASFSRVPNGTGDFVYAAPTKNAENGNKTGDIEQTKE